MVVACIVWFHHYCYQFLQSAIVAALTSIARLLKKWNMEAALKFIVLGNVLLLCLRKIVDLPEEDLIPFRQKKDYVECWLTKCYPSMFTVYIMWGRTRGYNYAVNFTKYQKICCLQYVRPTHVSIFDTCMYRYFSVPKKRWCIDILVPISLVVSLQVEKMSLKKWDFITFFLTRSFKIYNETIRKFLNRYGWNFFHVSI